MNKGIKASSDDIWKNRVDKVVRASLTEPVASVGVPVWEIY